MRRITSLFLFFAISLFCLGQTDDESRLDSILTMVEDYSDKGLMAESDSLLDLAGSLIDDNTSASSITEYKFYAAHSHLAKWELDEAETLFEEGIDFTTVQKDTLRYVAFKSGLATVKQIQGDFIEAIRLMESAKNLAADKDSAKYFGLVANLGIAYDFSGRYDKALTNYLNAKNFYCRTENFVNQAHLENNLGELYRERFQDYTLAENHYREAVRLNKSIGHKSNLGSNYHNLALNFYNTQRIDSAIYYVNESIELRSDMGEKGKLAADYAVLGDINLFQEDYEKAITSFNKTLDISQEYNIARGFYYGNLGLAEAYDATQKPHMALNYGLLALDGAKTTEAPSLVMGAYEWLYDFHKKEKRYAYAVDYLEKYHTINDSLNNAIDAAILNASRAEYETDLAQAESEKLLMEKKADLAELEYNQLWNFGLIITLVFLLLITLIIFRAYKIRSAAYRNQSKLNGELKESHTRISEQAEELKRLDKLKTTIVSVLGHDLRGPLTSVAGLVDLLGQKAITPEEFEEMIKQLGEKTNSGIKSLDLVLEWSRLKAGDSNPKLEYLYPEARVEEIIAVNQELISSKSLSVRTEFEQGLVLPADPNQFNSIATNLILNAIKFSHGKGSIEIGTEDTKEYVNFYVKDSGDGFSDTLINQVNKGGRMISSLGTKGEQGTGIGLRIVRDFVEAHNGKLHFMNEGGSGKVVVAFPKIDLQERKVS